MGARKLIQESKNILIISGAGISRKSGIPDFRSENGIYSMLGEYDLPEPESMFDIDYFTENPVPFFKFAKELLPGKYIPNISHLFLKELENSSKLLRVYTQNIDGLEKAAGVSSERVIQCHGSFDTVTCRECKHQVPLNAIRQEIESEKIPICGVCNRGIMKPDITFFGEALGNEYFSSIQTDLDEVDLVIVMGTSLKVGPVNKIINLVDKNVPQILINNELVAQPHEFDVTLLGNSEDVVGGLL
jgi:NAD-dependent deacetylase sirtuin 1